MDHEEAARRLAELGNVTRLAVFRYLVKAGPEGAPVGQIQRALGVPGSTLSHHIARLVSVGLIRQVRESRTLNCLPQYDALMELLDYMQSECCVGVCDGKEEQR
jgi:DNA-binding transcriptional ArsR family regulator